MQEMNVQSLGQEDPLEKEMAAHTSILAWKYPWTEKLGGLHSMELQRVGPSSECTCVCVCGHTHTHTHLRVTWVLLQKLQIPKDDAKCI